MAMDLLEIPREQNVRLYRLINANGLDRRKIGRTPLINRRQLESATGASTENTRFPAYIAVRRLEDLIDKHEAAEILEMTTRTIQNLGNSFIIDSIDLAPWGGHKLYSRRSVINEKNRRGMIALALKKKRTPRSKHAELGLA
jgi:hypothetical protein